MQVSNAVTHGVCIFALDHRFVGLFFGKAFHTVHAHIHRAVDVGVCSAVSLLVLYRACAVNRFKVIVSGHEVYTVSGFVTQTPDNHARLVFVALKHIFCTIQMRCFPVFVFSQRFVAVTHSMRFDVGFVNNVQTVFITQFVPQLRLRIVRCTNSIQVVFLHGFNVQQHGFFILNVAGFVVVLMQVGTFNVNVFSVHAKGCIDDFNATETNILADYFNNLFSVF